MNQFVTQKLEENSFNDWSLQPRDSQGLTGAPSSFTEIPSNPMQRINLSLAAIKTTIASLVWFFWIGQHCQVEKMILDELKIHLPDGPKNKTIFD